MDKSVKSNQTKTGQKRKQYPSFRVLIKSLLATVVLLGVVMAGMNFSGLLTFTTFLGQGDVLTQSEIQDRAVAFNKLTPMLLTVISPKDAPRAIESMQLSPAAKKALISNLDHNELQDTRSSLNTSKGQSTILPSSTKAIATATDNRVRLTWISLWDTDVEDGDTVRIDSQGYSRIVVLRNQPITFAVPIPSTGIINVTGISDGDGGGITVGLASGSSRAVFPIMSVGQVLGLKVTVN